MNDTDVLRDIADAWHACTLAGLTAPTAALFTETAAIGIAAVCLAHGHKRPAITLVGTATLTLAAAHLIH